MARSDRIYRRPQRLPSASAVIPHDDLRPWLRRLLDSRLFGAAVFVLTLALIAVLMLASIDWNALAGLGYLGLFGVTVLNNAAVVVPAPGLIATVLAARVLDPTLVGIVSGAGAAIGELSGYALGWSGSRLVRNRHIRRVSPRIRRFFVDTVERHWFLVFLVLSVIPNPFVDVAGLIAGAKRLTVWKFLLPVWIGKTVRMMLLANLGVWAPELL